MVEVESSMLISPYAVSEKLSSLTRNLKDATRVTDTHHYCERGAYKLN